MSTGPINFLSDNPDQNSGTSEYGGTAGIQPAPHRMTASETAAALRRAGATADGIDPVTGLDADDLVAG